MPPAERAGPVVNLPRVVEVFHGIPVLKGVGSIYEASMVLNPNKMIFQN
jgi:hypothetical protein